jgi:plasmid replication initiation protein
MAKRQPAFLAPEAQGVEQSPLQLDMFFPLLGIAEVSLRDVGVMMERPFFALSKRRIKPITYRSEDGRVSIEVTGNARYGGLATIFDADILIGLASAVRFGMARRQNDMSRNVHILPSELLRLMGWDTGGHGYARLCAALDRLQSTTVKTNLMVSDRQREQTFSWISEWRQVTDRNDGRSYGMVVVMSDWFWDVVSNPKNLLLVDRRYFALTSGIARWLYRLGRKHSGNNPEGFRIRFSTLKEKSGTESPSRVFYSYLRDVIEENELPGLHLKVEDLAAKDPMLWIVSEDHYKAGSRPPWERKAPSPARPSGRSALAPGLQASASDYIDLAKSSLTAMSRPAMAGAKVMSAEETIRSPEYAALLAQMAASRTAAAVQTTPDSAKSEDMVVLEDLVSQPPPAPVSARVLLQAETIEALKQMKLDVGVDALQDQFDAMLAKYPDRLPLDYEKGLVRFVANMKQRRQS